MMAMSRSATEPHGNSASSTVAPDGTTVAPHATPHGKSASSDPPPESGRENGGTWTPANDARGEGLTVTSVTSVTSVTAATDARGEGLRARCRRGRRANEGGGHHVRLRGNRRRKTRLPLHSSRYRRRDCRYNRSPLEEDESAVTTAHRWKKTRLRPTCGRSRNRTL